MISKMKKLKASFFPTQKKASDGNNSNNKNNNNNKDDNEKEVEVLKNDPKFDDTKKVQNRYESSTQIHGIPQNKKIERQIKALYDYRPPVGSCDELTFKMGDIMNILNDSDLNWWYVENLRTGRKGNVPSNYVTMLSDDDSTDAREFSDREPQRQNSIPPVISPRASNQIAIQKQVKALYDYAAPPDSADDMSFEKGDIMNIIDDSESEWWMALNTRSKEKGYIPYNFVALIEGIQSFDWFQGDISRTDSDKLLRENKNNGSGSFLIRNSETMKGTYTLSVLYITSDGDRMTKHYHIKNMDNSMGYFINPRAIFKTLEEMITYYSNNDSLCARLSRTCPRMKPANLDLSKSTGDKWEIDRKTLQKAELLGSGNFGEVWKGFWNSKRPVAIKMMKPGTMETSKFLEEAAVMKELRHPKLVRLYAVCTTEEPIYIVMEYLSKGCLQKYLKNDGGKTLAVNKLIDIAAQIANGMQYIESKGYIHRDLAARNVLVEENNLIKIADFGLSKAVITEEIYKASEDTKFPVKWTAIESINSQIYTIKSDVWSFGIVMVELLLYGETPYPGMTNIAVQTRLQGKFRHPKPAGCSDELYEIMLTCWHKNPENRPTFDTLFHTLDDFLIATQNSYD